MEKQTLISLYIDLSSYRRVFSSFRERGVGRGGCGGADREKRTRGSQRATGRTKGKDLNGLSQKAFSYSPWQTTMAKWREREHILNRFPSSASDIFMWRAEPARPGNAICTCIVYLASMLLEERTRRFFRRGGASNLKGLKRFPRGWRVGLSALERRSTDDDSFSLSYPPPRLIPFCSSPLSAVTIVTYCELLGEPCRLAERGSACPFRRGKFRAT